MQEIWKDINNYEGLYRISNYGNIINVKRNKIVKKAKDKDGYEVLSLSNGKGIRKQYRVHRLVAESFISNPHMYQYINHINEIKDDNRVENLEWCNARYNNLYGNRMLKIKKRIGKYDKNGNLLETYNSIKEARDIYKGNISLCCQGKVKSVKGFVWKYI